jgi:hypothetical protein
VEEGVDMLASLLDGPAPDPPLPDMVAGGQ